MESEDNSINNSPIYQSPINCNSINHMFSPPGRKYNELAFIFFLNGQCIFDQTCIKRSHLGQRKSDHARQATLLFVGIP